MAFTPVILIHLLSAAGAIVLGGIVLALRKGTRLHRYAGRIWFGLLLTAVLVSFGIKAGGAFSSIHLLSVGALFGMAIALYAALRRKIGMHRRAITCVYISLVTAGIFTLLPNRRLGHLVWHGLGLP